MDLAPGAALVFQLPCMYVPFRSIRHTIKLILPASVSNLYLRVRDGNRSEQLIMETHTMRKKRVAEVLESQGARIVHVRRDPNFDRRWISLVYYVGK